MPPTDSIDKRFFGSHLILLFLENLYKLLLLLLTLQSSQPLPGVLHLSYTRISVLPKGEEFLIMLDGLR